MVDILQSYIPPQYLTTNNNIQFDIPHSMQFYNVLAAVLTTSFPLDSDLNNPNQQIADILDPDDKFQPETQ